MRKVRDRITLLQEINVAGMHCVEVGVALGCFSSSILAHNPASLLLVDLWDQKNSRTYSETAFESTCKRFKNSENVRIERASSIVAARKHSGQLFDFVYLDADHRTPFTYADLFLWYERVRQGGWLAGHDWNNPDFKVHEAVMVFFEVTGETLAYLTSEKPGLVPAGAGYDDTRVSRFNWRSYALRRTKDN